MTRKEERKLLEDGVNQRNAARHAAEDEPGSVDLTPEEKAEATRIGRVVYHKEYSKRRTAERRNLRRARDE
jgi:hypothetical protein